jgi:hypothetical protein
MNNFNDETSLPFENELTDEEMEHTRKAVEALTLEHNPQTAAKFLKENPKCVYEFCTQVVDRYQEHDRYTPAQEISSVMAELLNTEKE